MVWGLGFGNGEGVVLVFDFDEVGFFSCLELLVLVVVFDKGLKKVGFEGGLVSVVLGLKLFFVECGVFLFFLMGIGVELFFFEIWVGIFVGEELKCFVLVWFEMWWLCCIDFLVWIVCNDFCVFFLFFWFGIGVFCDGRRGILFVLFRCFDIWYWE